MRHNVAGRRLGRGSNQRKALMKDLAIALLRFERIETTLPKAKELRSYVEPFITLAKKDTIANRRLVLSRLGNKEIVKKIFGSDFNSRFKDRPGGYTRIIKGSHRLGDGADVAIVELVDYVLPEVVTKEPKSE